MLWLAIALFGCNGKDDDSASAADDSTPGDDTSTPAVDIDWGVVKDCDVDADGGFDDFFAGGPAVLVYGEEEAAFVPQMLEWYGGLKIEPRAYADLKADDMLGNMIVIGSPASNPALMDLNGMSPVWFEDGDFVFGGHRYDEHGNGIALIFPSDVSGKWILVYAGNSFEGMYSTFTIWTGAADYETTRGRGVVMQEGDFCRSADAWGWYDDYVGADAWPTWGAWVDSLTETVTEHHLFRYLPDSYASENIDWSSANQEERYDDVIEALDVDPLDEPITAYLYPDNDTKGEITGEYGNGHANDLNSETHVVFGEDVDAFTIHEDVHVIAWYRIGESQYPLFGEGLAVAMDGNWGGDSLSSWASKFKTDGSLPSLPELEYGWWDIDDTTSYPVAGYFVEWLLDTYGTDTVKALYVAPDLDAAFESQLGMTHDEVEKAWLASIP